MFEEVQKAINTGWVIRENIKKERQCIRLFEEERKEMETNAPM